jgi:hypothetical protein
VQIKNSARIIPLLILIIIPFSLLIGTLFSRMIYSAADVYPFVVYAFGLYAFRYNTSQYFKKIGYQNGIIRYEYIKKITYLLVFVVIAASILAWITPYTEDPYSFVVLFLGESIMLLTGGFLWILAYHIRKEFEFHFAKAHIKVASNEENETTKAKYFMKGVKFYDKYLRRIFNLQINDINEVYNKFIFDSNMDNKQVFESLSLAFEKKNDGLNPVKCLLEIAKVENTRKFLVDLVPSVRNVKPLIR